MAIIQVSSVNEAAEKAQSLFKQGIEVVTAEGAATAGGALFAAKGTLVMVASGKAMWVASLGDVRDAARKMGYELPREIPTDRDIEEYMKYPTCGIAECDCSFQPCEGCRIGEAMAKRKVGEVA